MSKLNPGIMEVMGMSRHARRAIAKLNGVARIRGTNKPYVKPTHREGYREEKEKANI